MKCLRKPVLLLVVGSAASVECSARWEHSPYAKLVEGLPYVGNGHDLNGKLSIQRCLLWHFAFQWIFGP